MLGCGRWFAGTLLGVLGLVSVGSRADVLSGAGSSAAAPIYRSWGAAYELETGHKLNYESVGSSAGIRKIKAHEVGYGASDVAPSQAELDHDGLVVFPIAITGIAPVVNLPHIGDGQLRLSGRVLVQIFRGAVTRWNAPEIAQLNAGLALPSLPIRVIVRADGSGTTYNFANYLAEIDPVWRKDYGVKSLLTWPAQFLNAKGSEGVSRLVDETVGGIAYVDFAYVREFHLATVQLDNAAGEYLSPSNEAFRQALTHSDWASSGNFTSMLTNQPGRGSWPLTMGTFAVVPRIAPRPADTARVLRFFAWAFLKGDQLVQQNNFVRLPTRVQASAYKAMASVRDAAGNPIGMQFVGF